MQKLVQTVFLCTLTATPLIPSATAQTPTTTAGEVQEFTSENAILDTAIPFAIGSNEARQSLRGAFGWPTFQEGLVAGVYFRVDPDGYARFSPSPRLDTDVFEVVCRPRTYTCMGRKPGMTLIRNGRGELQLQLEDVLEGDTFFVSEGISEIQLPPRILQPLNMQLETLLSSGGDLIVRRGSNEVSRISITGLPAVATYLRWVAARQDYTVMPGDWPVPKQIDATSAAQVINPLSWESPMPQPQVPVAQAAPPSGSAEVSEEVARVRGELSVLRELLLARETNTATADALGTATPQIGSETEALSTEIEELRTLADSLRNALDGTAEPSMGSGVPVTNNTPVVLGASTEPTPADVMQTPGYQQPMWPSQDMQQPAHAQAPAVQAAQRLEYLMSEIGLDLQTALAVLQMTPGNTTVDMGIDPTMETGISASDAMHAGTRYKGDVVSQILDELETDFAQTSPTPATTAPVAEKVEIPNAEFQLLSDFFESIVIPADMAAQP